MKNLRRNEAKDLCDELMGDIFSDQDIAEILIELATKGETADEIAGFHDSLMQKAELFPSRKIAMDVCGTGGSGLDRFNVSTAVAFVLASLGVSIAKHGNRGSSKQNGSIDFLEALDIPIELDGKAASICLEEANLAFIYAKKIHPGLKKMVTSRSIAGCGTIFNLVGPLCNPANINKQVIGSTDEKLQQILFQTAMAIGREACIVVSGFPDIDEVSVAGPSKIMFARGIQREVFPQELGVKQCDYNKIPCGDAKRNAQEFHKIIEGDGNQALEDLVSINAGIALYCDDQVDDFCSGTIEARRAIRKGLVKDKFLEYKKMAVRISNGQ